MGGKRLQEKGKILLILVKMISAVLIHWKLPEIVISELKLFYLIKKVASKHVLGI